MTAVAVKIDQTNPVLSLPNTACKHWQHEALSITTGNFGDLSSELSLARELCHQYLSVEIKEQIEQINVKFGTTQSVGAPDLTYSFKASDGLENSQTFSGSWYELHRNWKKIYTA